MICPQCQTENRANAKFCNECGFSFVPQALDAAEGAPWDKPDPRAALKDIPLVDQPDEGFDFTEPADFAPADRDSVEDVARDMFPGRFNTDRVKPVSANADATADLTGLEKLVDSSYVPPAYSGRAGDTMEMPALGTQGASRDFRAQLSPKEQKKLQREKRRESGGWPKAVLVALLLLALAAGGAAFATYYLEMWGGKSVPDVLGQSQENASYALESEGFTVRPELVKSDDIAGIVLLTDPAAGVRVEEGSEVIIHVSESRIVPEVLGKTQEEAEILLNAEGFVAYSFVPEKSNDSEGYVLSVSVEQNTRALSTTPIEMGVSVPFTVPEVAELAQDEAQALLEAEGYQVTVRPYYTEEADEGIAVSTEPAAGTAHKSGETVTLYVTKSRASEIIDLAWSYLTSAGSFSIDGMSYEVSSVDAVEYLGDNTAAYTLTARYFETHYWFGFEAETRYGDYETLEGTITWSDSNEISGASPTIKRL